MIGYFILERNSHHKYKVYNTYYRVGQKSPSDILYVRLCNNKKTSDIKMLFIEPTSVKGWKYAKINLPGPVSVVVKRLTFQYVHHYFPRTVECAAMSISCLPEHFESDLSEDTAVGQAVVCARVTQRARVRSPVGTSFLGEVFSGFSSPVRRISGSFRPTRSPNIIWPS